MPSSLYSIVQCIPAMSGALRRSPQAGLLPTTSTCPAGSLCVRDVPPGAQTRRERRLAVTDVDFAEVTDMRVHTLYERQVTSGDCPWDSPAAWLAPFSITSSMAARMCSAV